MAGTIHAGLCLTCANAPTCAFRGTPDRPVLQCEEFAVCRGLGCEGPPAPDTPRADAGADGPGARLVGLCINCDDRESCSFPAARKGVCFCEEYG